MEVLTPTNVLMDTKRCAYCHKLLRADTSVCSRCGYTFSKNPRTLSMGLTKPSIPPASPHRVGHYSGLHPEDQPYQSSMVAVHRPQAHEQQERLLPQEPEHIMLPEVDKIPKVKERQYEPTTSPPVTPRKTAGLAYPGYPKELKRSRPLLPRRVIPGILALSCLFLLLASGILALVLVGRHSSIATGTAKVLASPNVLRTNDVFTLTGSGFSAHGLITFTYDVQQLIYKGGKPLELHADKAGDFAVKLSVPVTWMPGVHIVHTTDESQKLSVSTSITIQQPPSTPPDLQLSASSFDYGTDRAGTVANKILTLMNAGGGQITWQASSDATWLSTSPTSDTFSGREDVNVTVNRATLMPQRYTGHVIFESKSGAALLKLTVTMAVSPDPASLSISQSSLAYSASTNQNPPDQTLILQNNGAQAIAWTSSISTGDGSNWLSITPANGSLEAKKSATVSVSVRSLQLGVGSYQGTLLFAGHTSLQVNIALNVFAPGSLIITPPALTFNMMQGQNPANQAVTLQNTGGASLDWSLSSTNNADTANDAASSSNWLNATPASGTLVAGSQANVTIGVNGAALAPGSYQGIISLTSGSVTKQVSVALVVTTPPVASISVQGAALQFTTFKGTNPTSRTFSVTNTGNTTLNWQETEDGNGATFAPVTPTQGTLAPGKSALLTVSPNVSSDSVGKLQTTITIDNSDASAAVAPQKVAVSITVLDRAEISVSATSLIFNNTSANAYTSQPFSLTNTGSANLNWTVATPASWVITDVSSGTLAPGQQIAFSIRCDSSQLTPGTYKTMLTFTDTDANTSVTPQNVAVTLIVS